MNLISPMSGIYITVGTGLAYFMAISAIELYGRYLLRKDAKQREKFSRVSEARKDSYYE